MKLLNLINEVDEAAFVNLLPVNKVAGHFPSEYRKIL